VYYPIDHPNQIDAIKFRMEQRGLIREDLKRIVGSRARIAEVLSGKPSLSIAIIRRLHKELGIPAEILIG
jgi:HTH-type transcriptional regulator / antitoxin HigA